MQKEGAKVWFHLLPTIPVQASPSSIGAWGKSLTGLLDFQHQILNVQAVELELT